jgi:hypothetical protein
VKEVVLVPKEVASEGGTAAAIVLFDGLFATDIIIVAR